MSFAIFILIFMVPCNLAAKPYFECGKKTTSRIVGGNVVNPNEIPWQAFIGRSGSGLLKCGGTIISPYHILTAAHCFVKNGHQSTFKKDIFVAVAEHNIKRPDGEEKHEVSRIKIHYRYNPKTYNNDIAILYLKTAITFTGNATAACLPFQKRKQFYAGKTLTASGWGNTIGGLKWLHYPNKLRKVNLRGIAWKPCHENYNTITKNMICAKGIGSTCKDTSYGDSGGPLTLTKKGVTSVVGVVSSGYPCGAAPGFYTRVRRYKRWILKSGVYKEKKPGVFSKGKHH